MTESEEKLTFRRMGDNDWHDSEHPFWENGNILLGRICCCCSVAKSCPTLQPYELQHTPGFPVLHHLPEFPQINVHWISDAI